MQSVRENAKLFKKSQRVEKLKFSPKNTCADLGETVNIHFS